MLTDDIRKKALNVSPRAKQCPVGMDLAALGKKWTFHILRSIGISHIDRWCRAYLRLQRPRNCRSEGGYPNAFRREWRVRNPRAAQARWKYSSLRDAAYPQGRCQYRRIIISDLCQRPHRPDNRRIHPYSGHQRKEAQKIEL